MIKYFLTNSYIIVQFPTFISELVSCVVWMPFSTAFCFHWAAALLDEDLYIQEKKHIWTILIYVMFNFIIIITATLLQRLYLTTIGGSLHSVLPSDILLSEPQEVGEYSLFWPESKRGVHSP